MQALQEYLVVFV